MASDIETVARPYAEAAYGYASEQDEVGEWEKMLGFAAAVSEDSRSCHVLASYVDLEARNTRNSAVRRPDLGRIVRECGEVIAIDSRHISKKRPRELHSISRVPGKADHHIVCVDYFVLHYWLDHKRQKAGLAGPALLWNYWA